MAPEGTTVADEPPERPKPPPPRRPPSAPVAPVEFSNPFSYLLPRYVQPRKVEPEPPPDPDTSQAVFQVSHRRPSEMGNMAEGSPVAQKTPALSDRSFDVALAAYGAIFGAGVLQLAARDWVSGSIFSVGGGLWP